MNVPADFVLVSGGEEVPASFYMMAVWCNTLRSLGVHHPTFEVPSVDRRALETFRDCVYLLSFDKAQSRAKITGENFAAVGALCDVFGCPELAAIVDEFVRECENSIEMLVQQLKNAISHSDLDMCSRIESSLARNLESALRVLKDVPISQVPAPYLFRIVEHGMRNNPEGISDLVLCDFILRKVVEDECCCHLVSFLRVDRLPLRKFEELMLCEPLQGFFFRNFPIRFVHELLRNVNSTIESLRAELASKQEAFRAQYEVKIAELSDRLQTVSNLTLMRQYTRVSDIPPSGTGTPLTGIIARLHQEPGDLSEHVQVTSTAPYSGQHSCNNILSLDLCNFFFSTTPNPYFQFRFVNHGVIPSHYGIRTYDAGKYGDHLKSWVLECSQTGVQWLELDRRVDNQDLNGVLCVQTFQIERNILIPYPYFRVRLIGPNHAGRNKMACCTFELFGKLVTFATQ